MAELEARGVALHDGVDSEVAGPPEVTVREEVSSVIEVGQQPLNSRLGLADARLEMKKWRPGWGTRLWTIFLRSVLALEGYLRGPLTPLIILATRWLRWEKAGLEMFSLLEQILVRARLSAQKTPWLNWRRWGRVRPAL